MSLFQLKLKSFNPYFIKISIQYILQIVHFLGIANHHTISLPKKIKKFTVLRSPHIDKKSREQFEIRKYKDILQISIPDRDIALLFLEILKNIELIGIELEINVRFIDHFVY